MVDTRFFRLLGYTALACAPLSAWANSALQIYVPLQDSRYSGMLPLAPRADFEISKSVDALFSTAARFSAELQSKKNSANAAVRAEELSLTVNAEPFIVSAGKLLIRPFPSKLNERSRDFLHEEPSAEGLECAWAWAYGKASLFLESDLAFSLAQQIAGLRVSAIHRIELSKLTQFEQTMNNQDSAQNRAVRTHDSELQLSVDGHEIEVESLLQIRQQGAARFVTPARDIFSKPNIGGIDRNLPSGLTDYRFATQLRTVAGRYLKTTGWYVYGIAARNTLTSFKATQENSASHKSNSNSYLFTFAVDTENSNQENDSHVFAQLGVSYESSSDRIYRLLGTVENDQPVLVKGKFTSWFTTRYTF